MKTDNQIRSEGMMALLDRLGPAEATRFVTLIQREGFDYTKCRQNLFDGKTLDQIHAELDRLCAGAPAGDAQAALRNLRQ